MFGTTLKMFTLYFNIDFLLISGINWIPLIEKVASRSVSTYIGDRLEQRVLEI